jgi:hypothetical protein
VHKAHLEVQVKQNYFRPLLACLLMAGMAFPAVLVAQSDGPMPTPSRQPAASPQQQQDSLPAYGKQPKPMPDATPAAAPSPTAPQQPAASSMASSQSATPQNVVPATVYQAMPQYQPIHVDQVPASAGSTYIPVDSWIYPALMRLYSMGYLDTAYLAMRPWTRLSVLRMLDAMQERIHMDSNNGEALEIYNAVLAEVAPDLKTAGGWTPHGTLESTYERMTGIGGTPLNDSYHLGLTIINNYGRPYEQGFNDYTGFSTRGEMGRFTLYVRGEYQHAPSATGYSAALAQTLANNDGVPDVPQSTIPAGPIAAQNYFRLLEANLSVQLLQHEISIGKSDVWDGPALGGAFDWSNNAQDIYSFRINRVEPLHLPLLSYFLGPVRYEFLVGSLKGHTDPNSPWVHMEKFEFKPSGNFEFGFSRTIIWGGKGHEPITLGSFWNSFTSFQNVSVQQKYSTNDPGARFSTFDYTYRLPFLRNWLTQYTDSESHDDVTPVSAPRRAGIRTGLYLSHFPGAPKFDLRAEAVYTDLSVSNSQGGSFMYYETIQRQGYTNEGNIFGDWIGRESKGGQAWLTYHLSGTEFVQLAYRNAKAAKDFIPGGTTQNDFTAKVVKSIRPQVELDGWMQYERWKAPIYKTGGQSDVTTTVQVTWYPQIKRGLRKW